MNPTLFVLEPPFALLSIGLQGDVESKQVSYHPRKVNAQPTSFDTPVIKHSVYYKSYPIDADMRQLTICRLLLATALL